MNNQLRVKVSSVSITPDKLTAGFRVDRLDTMPEDGLAQMDAAFTGVTLDVKLTPEVGQHPDAAGQQTWDTPLAFRGRCDGFTVREDHIKLSVHGVAPDDDAERGLWTRLGGHDAVIRFAPVAAVEPDGASP